MTTQHVSIAIQPAPYDRKVTLILDLQPAAVDHLEVRVPAGATIAAGEYTGPLPVTAVRIGAIERIL